MIDHGVSGTLSDALVLVAGATGTVGRAVCAAVSSAGGRVLAQYRGNEDAARALRSAGARTVRADLSTEEGHRRLAEAVTDVGGVDALVNTVHTASATARVGDLPMDVLHAHLDGVALHARLVQHVLPGMRTRSYGRVVFVSGALAVRPAEGNAAYGAAKAAAETLTRYVAWEEGASGVTANIVAPGRVADPDVPYSDLAPEWAALAEALLPRLALRRFPSPDEVAQAVLGFLLPSASGLTGQTVWVTGGESLR